jgi:hypothetical protein
MQSLRPSIYASRDTVSLKFRLPCSDVIKETGTTEGWLMIKKYLGSNQYNNLLGSLKNNKQVVVKFGEPDQIIKEYQFGQEAHNASLPNFIKFLCAFTCDDSETSIKTQDFTRKQFLCNGSGNGLGIMVMPYYSDGNIDQCKWNRGNFGTLKNVLTQVAWSLLYAFEKTGFVHGDMHAGNVLVRRTKKAALSYGGLSLGLHGMYAIVMDFGKSYIQHDAPSQVYQSIDRLLNISLHLENSDIILENNKKQILTQMIIQNDAITTSIYVLIKEIIDNLQIRYAKSEIPTRHI